MGWAIAPGMPAAHSLRYAGAASRWWARTCASGSTLSGPSSSCTATFATSGPAAAARDCRATDHRQGHAGRGTAGPYGWSAASSTTCLTTGKSRSTPTRACTRRASTLHLGPLRPGRTATTVRRTQGLRARRAGKGSEHHTLRRSLKLDGLKVDGPMLHGPELESPVALKII